MLGRDVSPVEIADIFAAEWRLRKVFPPSPLLNMEFLNQQLGAQVWLKAENLLPSGAYKYRGAMNKITSLIERYGKELRIVTASSGNHGMACALAARNLGGPSKCRGSRVHAPGQKGQHPRTGGQFGGSRRDI